MTVLFADVVHSMDIAASVGAERLREIMAELVNVTTAVVKRYGGTVDKFTGDGIMAVFGAPVALEDHATRACLAALAIQEDVDRLATEVEFRDKVSLRLRIGLNSGEVIAGEVGSSALGYTAIGEQVGMAQRMESVAPRGGVMLSESTVRLVEDVATLDDPKLVHVKGAETPVSARRLRGVAASRERPRLSALVGRGWELAALTAMLDRAINGHGCVASVVGPPGIGKSRIVAETVSIAADRGTQVFSTFCESHTSEVPLHASSRLLRAALGVEELDGAAARALVSAAVPDADPADLLLLHDALGIADAATELPDIAPDARRRRLTALVNTIALSRATPSIFVIEDAHWVDPPSESLFADFLSIIPQTHSLVLVTYRPEYQGALSRTPGAQSIALAPLEDSQTAALVGGLIGSHPSVAALSEQIIQRAAGNPFFAEQIVRDLADRGVLAGERGGYECPGEVVDVEVPATLQAAIAARIDRLDDAAKRTLNAAAVIGMRFGDELLAKLNDNLAIAELVRDELIDQVRFTPFAEYAFRHPLIRSVAYRSQLKSDRAELHRRLAGAIEETARESADENAALIGEHLQAAGDLSEAFAWFMRAGNWLRFRDIKAARMCWQRARDAADQLPTDDPARAAMRISPRALLCLSAFRTAGGMADTGFDELRELAATADDKVSLATGYAGQVSALVTHGRYREASELASELTSVLESIGDSTLTLSLQWAALPAKALAGEISEVLRVGQRIIDLAEGDPLKGNIIIESPLAVARVIRAVAGAYAGEAGWKSELDSGMDLCRQVAPVGYPIMLMYKYTCVVNGTLSPSAITLQQTSEAFDSAQRSGDDWTLESALALKGLVLLLQDGPEKAEGFELLARARDAAVGERSSMVYVIQIDREIASEMMRRGDTNGAVEMLRRIVNEDYNTGDVALLWPILDPLVEALLRRGTPADIREAQAAVDRFATAPRDPAIVLFEVQLLRLRALLARARGDDKEYRAYRDRYRAMATSLDFEGHMKWAEEMP